MDALCQEYRFRKPWAWVLAAGGMALVALGIGAWRAVVGYPMAPHMAATSSSLALIGLGLVLGGVALTAARAAVSQPARLVLSDAELSFPGSRFSTRLVHLGWEQIQTLRTADLGDEQQLELVWPQGNIHLVPTMLQNPQEFPTLRAALIERLSQLGVAAEDASRRERARRFRPQFSIAYLFLMITIVAILLGTHRYAYGGYASDVWVEIVITVALMLAAPWATVRLPRWVWIFAIGFGLGFWLEGLATVTWLSLGWLQFTPGPRALGWFPLTAVVRHLAASSPALAWLDEGVWSYLLATLLAGILGGLVALAVRGLWRLAQRRRIAS